jgi:hydroxymethylbilane synthase
MAEEVLVRTFPERKIVQNVITSTGDRRTDVPLSEVAKVEGILDKGVFIKELEVALEAGEVDIAVHSLKDVPTVLEAHFEMAGVLERAPVRDVLISCHPEGLDGLPEGATVATSSVRRQRQLQWLRPDLKVVDIRGNVQTRLRKLAEDDGLDATMLAEAGLVRLGTDLKSDLGYGLYATPLDPETFLPAAGQGAVGFEIRKDDEDARACVQAICHAPTMLQVRGEREFLRLLDAGCHTPVGVLSWLDGETLYMRARVFDESDTTNSIPPKQAEARGPSTEPEDVARNLYQSLL